MHRPEEPAAFPGDFFQKPQGKERIAMLYHASQVSGLTVLLPQTSTHQTPYVYAIRAGSRPCASARPRMILTC